MHLINTGTLKLEEFNESAIPKYAILSHTWGDDEVTFEELQCVSQDELVTLERFKKIHFTASEARRDGLRYLWVDTCCIDKSSSAELSNAINSMFNWYRGAEICYTYLSDVDSQFFPDFSLEDYSLPKISRSRWFTRGWTLQELIAPRRSKFFGYPWTLLGSKENLMQMITQVTGIPEKVLQDADAVFDFSVAQRMSWAAERATTRLEDQAYCLLGIFGIAMPLLYGEGNKAFFRLQEEILKRTSDFSLFAWEGPEIEEVEVGSLFADSPRAFLGAERTAAIPGRPKGFWMRRRASLMVSLPVFPFGENSNDKNGIRAIAMLPCWHNNETNVCLGLLLTKSHTELPWKRIRGGNKSLVRIATSNVDRGTIQVIEVDISTACMIATEERRLEYHGRMPWPSLTGEGGNRWIGGEHQELWNTVIKRMGNDLHIKSEDSNSTMVAVTISPLDMRGTERISSPQAQPAMPYERLGGANVGERNLDSEQAAVRLEGMRSREMETHIGAEDPTRSCGSHSPHLPFGNTLNRETASTKSTSAVPLNELRRFSKQSASSTPLFSTGDTGVGEASTAAEGLGSGSEIGRHKTEENSVDAERQMLDCESMDSDVDSDDTSSILSATSSDDENASLRDVLVDVLADIITKRRGVPSAMLGDTTNLDNRNYISNQTDRPAEKIDATGWLRGRKRKADPLATDRAVDCVVKPEIRPAKPL